MINQFKYFTKSESQTIAVWIQTLILGIGLFYAMVQIDFISSNYEIEMNTRYMKHHSQYRDEINRKTGSVYDFYANIKDEKSANEIPLTQLKNIRALEKDVFKFYVDLSTCADFGLCPSKRAKSLICSDAIWLDTQLKRVEPLFKKQGKKQITKASGYYQYWLRSQCDWYTQGLYYLGYDFY